MAKFTLYLISIHKYFFLWPFPARILCEELLQGDEPFYDYNFFCYDGIPRIVEVVCRQPSSRQSILYDMDWNIIPRIYRHSSPYLIPPEKPAHFPQMEEIARRLSHGLPFVRVDLQYINGRVYFGEMTFYPFSGIAVFNPPSLDLYLGSYLILPRNRYAPVK